ncbi:MAG: GNAT family N-acetyltransferase [Candidatus Limnocylindrales bacterium]
MIALRRGTSDSLLGPEIDAIRTMLVDAFAPMARDDGAFEDADWDHALGGIHVVLESDGEIVAHAAVVERTLEIAGRPVRTGYVEAVATRIGHHGLGHGSTVMTEVNTIIRAGFELGALGTGRFSFYERLGWERWRGPSSVRRPDGPVQTPAEDGYLLVLRTPTSPTLDLDAPISCDWRPGDVW